MKSLQLDPVVKKELRFMAIALLICTVLVQAVFFLLSFFFENVRWDYTVAAGGVLGYCLAQLNFFLMCLAVQRSVSDPDPQHAQLAMKASYTRRMLLILAVMIVSFVVDAIHWLPVVAAVFYPTIVIFVRQFWTKYVLKQGDAPSAEAVSSVPVEDDEEDGEDEFEKAISRFAGKIDTDYLKNVPEKTERTDEKEG